MATITTTICDSCQQNIDEKDVNILEINRIGRSGQRYENFDLCPTCLNKVVSHLKSVKEHAELFSKPI